MNKIFISDLHLEAARPDIVAIFFQFLHGLNASKDELYILGDFFEVWIGDDDLSPFNQSIIMALKAATARGVRIYLMHGNRDFLLGRRFLKATGCLLLKDPCIVDIHGTPTLLMHGDTLCTHDVKYLKFRKKTRHWLVKQFILLKSLTARKAMAQRYRKASKAHTRVQADYIMDVTQHEVERVMQLHHVQHLIHGHTHREAMHHFMLAGKPATRIVLGAWHTEGHALICKANGDQTLIEIN